MPVHRYSWADEMTLGAIPAHATVGGLGQVYPHGDIDDKPLPGHSLVVVDPVPTMHGQAAQFDSVSHRVLSFPLPSTLRPP